MAAKLKNLPFIKVKNCDSAEQRGEGRRARRGRRGILMSCSLFNPVSALDEALLLFFP
jgi:hypothetical protein